MKTVDLVEKGRFLGEDFLLWLWARGLANGGTSGLDGDNTAMFVDDAFVLVNERGDVKELSLKKGNPAESREAFEALSRGMRPSKAKMRLLQGDQEWTFTLMAATLDLNGMKLPPSQAKDPAGRLADRLFLIEEGSALIENRFGAFLDQRVEDGELLQAEMHEWIRSGLKGALETVEVE